jgi:hypothetical protein
MFAVAIFSSAMLRLSIANRSSDSMDSEHVLVGRGSVMIGRRLWDMVCARCGRVPGVTVRKREIAPLTQSGACLESSFCCQGHPEW